MIVAYCFTRYMVAENIEDAVRLAQEYGPDAWHDSKTHAEDIANQEGDWNVYRIEIEVKP